MILVTGASGFLGGHLLVHLLKKESRIRALIRTQSRFDELQKIASFYGESFETLYQRVEWVAGDLLNPESLDAALTGVEAVYHCAAVVSFNSASAGIIEQTNVRGTANLVDACLRAGIKKFAYSSSIGALGQSVHGEPVDEETPWCTDNTSSVYSNSKYYAEQEVWRGIKAGLQASIVNPGVIFGAGDITKGCFQFLSVVDRNVPFYTPSSTGYVDVRDVCKIMILLMDKQIVGQRFILVSDSLANKDLFSMIAVAMKKPRPFLCAGKTLLTLAYHLGNVLKRTGYRSLPLTKEIIRSAVKKDVYSNKKIKEWLGIEFIPMEKTIPELVQFYKQ